MDKFAAILLEMEVPFQREEQQIWLGLTRSGTNSVFDFDAAGRFTHLRLDEAILQRGAR